MMINKEEGATMKRLDKLFMKLAKEMFDNGYQEINGTMYYRHPDPLIVSKVTMSHSDVIRCEDGYFKCYAEQRISMAQQIIELSQELKRRYRSAKYCQGYNSWGEAAVVWSDPYSFKNGVRRYLKESLDGSCELM